MSLRAGGIVLQVQGIVLSHEREDFIPVFVRCISQEIEDGPRYPVQAYGMIFFEIPLGALKYKEGFVCSLQRG